MRDVYNRKIDYIRISVTDRCNLRCIYCMPEEGIKFLEHKDLLSYEEIIYLCKAFSKVGISNIKITGGEPLVRKNLPYLIRQIRSIEGIKNVSITTNGILLEKEIDNLVRAGLDGINISIDTLNERSYKEVTRLGNVSEVIRGIDKALEYKNLNIKINCVPIKGVNEKELLDIVRLAKDRNISVRFIEIMPIGLGIDMKGLNEEEVKDLLKKEFGQLTEYKEKIGNGPSKYYSLEGFKGKVGFISAVSHNFCGNCNRVRLTSTGFLKACLQFEKGCDLRSLITNGINEEELIKEIEKTIYNKPKSHIFLEKKDKYDIEKGSMSQIGG